MNYQQQAQEILNFAGGKENISSFTNCMTRLRIDLIDKSNVDTNAIKQLEGVMGIVAGDQLQIIVGPGHAQRLREAFEKVSGMLGGEVVDAQIRDVADETKAAIKAKQKTSLHAAFRHIGNIFMPIIPGFIACGLVTAITNVLKAVNPEIAVHPWFLLVAGIGSIIFGILAVIVGYNSAREFGGSPILGAIAASLIYLPQLGAVSKILTVSSQPLLGVGYGGIIGVIFAAFIFATIEKRVRKIIPAALDLFLVPLITLILGSLITFFIIMPISAILMKGITYVLIDLALQKGGVFGGYILSATFLPLVMLGIHQGLTPIHAQLIKDVGYTVLLPVLAQAGAGQVGMAMAVYIKTKDKKLKSIISSALPIGFLGIGEPLIYGVSLPLFYPFITACLGAGFGGALITFFSNHGDKIGASAFGLSGLLMIPLIANKMWFYYLLGIIASYIGGFVLTYLFGYKEEYLEKLK
ncbi:MAG: PTS transporter subunit EIIC [Elusimicrobiota bacterium]|jgi:PTS system sucrose-specific IIC component|nr:PTS transporter subunit EIIC [Elusimicrobiota bacterium]